MQTTVFHRVFHPTDFSKGDRPAFLHALKIALSARAILEFLHVNQPAEHFRWSAFPHVRETLSQWNLLPNDAQPDDLTALGLRAAKVQRVGTDPVEKIAEFIAGHRPDLVVLATHQRQGVDRLLHKGIAEPLARRAHATTLFVPRGLTGFVDARTGQTRLRRILIPVDRSPDSRAAVEEAAGLVRTLGVAEVHFALLYVGKDTDMPEISVPLDPGWTSEERAWDGNVVEHILESAEADDIDLIVMATQGHMGFLDAVRGSTTERVLRDARCPVLAVPAFAT